MPNEPRVGLQFTERMTGWFLASGVSAATVTSPRDASARSNLECVLTIISTDLYQWLTDRSHSARLTGTVTAPALSAAPLTVIDGEFNLFTVDPNSIDTRQIRYRMKLEAADGSVYLFEAMKLIHDDPGFDVWSDTTTLYYTIYGGDNATGQVVGKGILRLTLQDFLRELRTLQVTNAPARTARWQALFRFGRFFARNLLEIYGGIFAPPKVFDPTGPQRPKRLLELPPKEEIWLSVPDALPDRKVRLRLTRYQGGPKGPVILSPGFGTSTLAFAIDTIEPNIVEYLCRYEYDVWLLDYRASPALEAARSQFTIDDIATKDYPAAVEEVRRRTAREVQFLGHCVGSMSLLMSVLAGLQGIRSAVCSQVTLHPVVPRLNKIKGRLRLADILERLGLRDFTTDFDTRATWRDWLFEILLRLYPTSRHCNNPVCRRILFLYGEVFDHNHLNEATHDATHEMFGVANVTAFQQLSKIVTRSQAVDHQGRDIYLPPLDRLAIPIAFIQGEVNPIFLSSGTERTYKLLCEHNGSDLYTYHVLPNYAHMDCFIGRNAARDVFPVILAELEKANTSGVILYVVARRERDWCKRLKRVFATDERVSLILDRRVMERRCERQSVEAERRRGDRRQRPHVEAKLREYGLAMVGEPNGKSQPGGIGQA